MRTTFVRRSGAVTAAALVGLTIGTPPAWAETTVEARLQAVNDSGVKGRATLTAHDDGSLTVVLRGTGYVPEQPHAQHVHGSLGSRHFMCPSMANDKDGDGVVTNEEGTGEYGAIFLALTTRGDTTPESGLSIDRMPVADASGRVDYRRRIAAADVPDRLLANLNHVHVVQHGIDTNGNGRYDLAALGPSTFARNLGLGRVPEEATNPASCGVVTGARAPVPPQGGIETGDGGTHAVHGSVAGSSTVGVNGALAGLGGLLIAVAAALVAGKPKRGA